MGLQSATAVAIALRVGLACGFGLPLAYQVLLNLTVTDWIVLVALALGAVHCYRVERKGAPRADTTAAPARRRPARLALPVAKEDPISVELDACLGRAGEPRAPFELLGSLHAAGLVRPAHVARVASSPVDDAQLRDALTFAHLAKVPLDNDAVVAVLTSLCDMDAGEEALEIWRTVSPEYYVPVPCLEALLVAAARRGSHADVEELFRQMQRAATPSVKSYALAIFAHGCRGDVSGCLGRYDEVQVDREGEDLSAAWNSLLTSLIRNAFMGRAAQLFAQGEEHMKVLPAVARALRA